MKYLKLFESLYYQEVKSFNSAEFKDFSQSEIEMIELSIKDFPISVIMPKKYCIEIYNINYPPHLLDSSTLYFSIYKQEDEWFFIQKNHSSLLYRCDQFQGLLKCLEDKLKSYLMPRQLHTNFLKLLKEASNYIEIPNLAQDTHLETSSDWEKNHREEKFSRRDITVIKKIFNKIKQITPNYLLKNSKLADKFKILIGDERQQDFRKVNPDLPFRNGYNELPHMIEIEIVNIVEGKDPNFSLKIFIKKFSDEYFKIDYFNKYREKEWIYDQMSHRSFICDQIDGLEEFFSKIISEISDDFIF